MRCLRGGPVLARGDQIFQNLTVRGTDYFRDPSLRDRPTAELMGCARCQRYSFMAVAGKVGRVLCKERVGIYNVGIMSVETSSESVDGC